MQTPQIGKTVHFWEQVPHGKPNTPKAAIIVFVWNDTMVNLVMFDANGVTHQKTSVQLLEEPNLGGYCATFPKFVR